MSHRKRELGLCPDLGRQGLPDLVLPLCRPVSCEALLGGRRVEVLGN